MTHRDETTESNVRGQPHQGGGPIRLLFVGLFVVLAIVAVALLLNFGGTPNP